MGGRKGGREISICERNIHWLPLACLGLGTWPTTQNIPWAGIKPANYILWDDAPTIWAMPAKAVFWTLCLVDFSSLFCLVLFLEFCSAFCFVLFFFFIGTDFFLFSFWLLSCICFYVLGRTATSPHLDRVALCIRWPIGPTGTVFLSSEPGVPAVFLL